MEKADLGIFNIHPSLRQKRKRLWGKIKKYRLRYLMILPGMFFFIIYKYIPMYGLLAAFQQFNPIKGISGSKWVGFQHFMILFKYGDFRKAFINSITISAMKITASYICVIILALLLNELKNGLFKKTVQTITYLPHFLSWVTLYGIFLYILAPESGALIKFAVNVLHLPRIDFFTNPKIFRFTLVLTNLWQSVGWGTIIYLAALAGVDTELYEAAAIDGANRFRRMWHISLPSIKPIIILTLILSSGHIMNQNFDQIFMFKNPIVADVSEVFETIVYNQGMQMMNYGYATAVGLFQSLVGMILTIAANKAAKNVGEEGIW